MISFEKVTKIYKKNVVAVQDITFQITPGEFLFIVGKTGAGKSTLLKLLTHEIIPTRGTIYLDGCQTSSLPKKELPYLRRKFGIVPQESKLLEKRTVYENIAFVLEVTRQPEEFMEQAVPAALGLVGMNKKAAAYPEELSGGERLRVSLARALVLSPAYLILDEPTANLDRGLAWDIVRLLLEINKKGVTVIMASHDREMINIVKKRVITIKHGKLVGDAKHAKYNYLL